MRDPLKKTLAALALWIMAASFYLALRDPGPPPPLRVRASDLDRPEGVYQPLPGTTTCVVTLGGGTSVILPH